MSTLFDDRERAAEYGFTHEEELRFLARRKGVEALAAWAAEGMGLDAASSADYVEATLASFVHGEGEIDLVNRVRSDLERAGKPALSTTANDVLTRATAAATMDLHGTRPRPPSEPKAEPRAEHHRSDFWGW